MSGSDVCFGVLGPLTVAQAGKSIAIGGRKERLVLAQLLARANAVVSVDALVEGVWNGSPPRSAERTLQAYVARLRRAIEPPRDSGASPAILVTAGAGYRLDVASGQLDALRFEQLARQGAERLRRGDDGASRILREALDLWRGDAYAEFDEVDWCGSEARRLAELRLVALEDRLDADLAAGGASELVPELESLVADHPFRERMWGELMLALYRAGRQADALAAYRRARTVLTEELGLEPGPELRRLEAAILAQDSDLDRVRARTTGPLGVLPAPLAAVGPAFVGRVAELAWLRSAWAQAAGGRGGFVSVLGPEGIGKTRLLAELAHEVQDGGAIVLYGRCDHAHRGPRALLDETLRSGGSSLTELDGAEVPRTDLAGAVARFLPTWAAHRSILIALDDLHLADSDTLEVVADLASWSGADAMLVVAAFRTDAAGGPTSESASGDRAAQVTLGGLDGDAVGELCAVYDSDGWTPADVGRLHELTGGVPLRVHEQASEWARRRAVDRVEDAADRSTAARRRLAVSRGEIADSVEGIQRLLEERRVNLAAREVELAAPGLAVCPYKGLAAFEAADSANFYGRERLVAELAARLAGARLLAVIGPSGSGKSSVVRAGLLPALDAGVIPVIDGWSSVILTPGADPARTVFRRLAAARPPAGRRAVFIDQFEEAFTVCTDDASQAQFVDQVVDLSNQDDTVVILTVRADHVGHCAAHPALADLISGNQVLVGPMRDAELRRAIELPARRAGLNIEAGLVDVIVSDVAGRPGALPLLSTALAETWERRTDRTLTVAGYRAAGGVSGALARMAEDAYLTLGEEARAAAQRVLLRLADAGDDGAVDLRRRLPLGEVVGGDHQAGVAVEALVARRLLTVDGDSVEVAHEALLREWPRLKAWLDEDVQGRRLHRHLGDAARGWRATREDPSELYRGTRLDAALDWARTRPADLNEAEQAFLDAGRQLAEHEVADARRRAAEKARANRRLRALLGGVAALLVVALVSGLLFLRQRNRAEQASLETRARELAALATLAIDEDPERAILLGLAAAEHTDEPSAELLSALHRATQSTQLTSRIDGVMNLSMDQSPDGSMLAVDRLDDIGYRLIDTASGRTVADVTTDYEISDHGLAFDPSGSELAVAYGVPDDESVPAVELFDVASGRPVSSLSGPPGYYCCSLQYDPTGRWLGTLRVDATDQSSAAVWDVTAGGSPKLFGPAYDFELAGDGTSIVVGNGTGLAVVDIATGQRSREIDAPAGVEYWDFEIDPTGKLAALVSQLARRVDVIDMETAEVRGTLELRDPLFAQFSPDGGALAITAEDGLIRVYDTDQLVERERLAGTAGAPFQIFFAPDGSRVLSARTGEIRTWDISPVAPRALGNFHVSGGLLDRLVVAADESAAYATVHTNAGDISSVHRVDLRSGVDDEVLGDVRYYFSTRPLMSPDLSVVAALDEAYVTQLVQRPGGDSTPLERCESVRAFDRSGRVAALDAYLLCTERGQEPRGGSRIVDLETGRTLLDLGETVIYAAAFGPPGDDGLPRSAIVEDRDSAAVTLYDLATGAAVGTYLPDAGEWPRSLAMSTDGTRLALLMDSGRLIVLDVERIVEGDDQTAAKVVDIVAHGAGSKAIDVSHSGLIATGSSADGVRVWSRDGELLASVPTQQPDPPTFTFAPGTDTLYYEDGRGVVRRFAVDLDDVKRLARSVLTRGFTPQECARYFPDEPCPTFDA